MRYVCACAALVVLLAGCGGGGSSKASTACRAQATKVAEHASSMLLHYRGGTVYPADMSYLGLQQSLDLYEKAGCPKDTLGQTVRDALTPRQRQTLLALLPRPSASRIHNALAAA